MKMLKKFMAIMLALLMMLSVVPAFAETIPSADGITLSRTSSYITVGMTVQLTAAVSVNWTSSNNAVATVSETGLVTAVAVGNADITATTADGKTAVCKVYVSEIEIRNHTTTPTPALDGGEFLTDLFDKEKFKVMLTFDDNATDVTGNVTTTVKDTLKYEDGFNGKAANFTNGYVELTDAVLGKDSITISTWVKTASIVSDPPDYIISTTPHNPGQNVNDGFYAGLRSSYVDWFYIRKPAEDIANGYRHTASVTVGTDTPTDIYDGWVNLTWVVNKKNNRLLFYVDYNLVKNIGISAAMKYDGEWAPMLGRGVYTGGTTIKYDGLMDDFFIYDGAMTTEDLQKIKAYYKLVQVVPTESMTLNTNNLSLDINEVSTLKATVSPSNATMQGIVWTTSDSSVATVDKGRVRGVANGNATITATTVDGGFVDSCQVTVNNTTVPFEYDRVCIIGIDGAGAWLNDDFMPNVQRIFGSYATTEENMASLPSISGTNWLSILNGVGYEHHRRNNYITGGTPYPIDSPHPTIFRVLREAEPDAEMAYLGQYFSVNVGMIENNLGAYMFYSEKDAIVHEKALEYLSENDPRLLFLLYGETDHAGHTYGYGPEIPEYVEAMKIEDRYIAEIYETYEEKGLLDTTLFILCTDHGGIGIGHGGDSPQEVYKYLALSGPGVKRNSIMGESKSHDVAAIAAHALGLERPAGWTAKVPDGAFDGVFGQTRNEVALPSSDHRDHVNIKTPTAEGSHLTDIFGEEKFAALLEFDDESAADVTGNNNTTVNKTLTYEEGYFGKGADFSKGSVTLEEIELNDNSFTIGMWMKTDGFTGRPLLAANKELSTLGDGFYAVIDEDVWTVGIRDGNNRISLGYNYFPKDFKEGWTHVMIVVDKTRGVVSTYIDFQLTDGQITQISVPTAPITIGSDGDANHAYPLTATLDDVFVYNGAMTSEDIAKLQTYYRREGAKVDITDVKFNGTVSFDYTVNGDTTDTTIYAAVYDESMKLIDVKKLPLQVGGGYGIKNAENAKYLKVFLIDNSLTPKCVPATATKN